MKVVNKTAREMPLEFRLENITGDLSLMGTKQLVVPAGKLAETPVLIELNKEQMAPGRTPIVVGVYSEGRKLETLKTIFIGPRAPQH